MRIWKRMMGLLLLIGCLSGCAAEERPEPTEMVARTVVIRSAGGMALEGVKVVALDVEAVTDRDGRAVLTVPEGTGAVTLDQVPLGYQAEAAYPLTGEETVVTLTSRPIPQEQGSPTALGLGDIMYDLTLETTDGPLTLSQVLEEKDVVLLQFWYSTCPHCRRGFSSLEVACSSYRQQVQVIAVDPLEKQEVVARYKDERGISFPMAACPSSWRQIFGVHRYPATFVIDRYGMICLVHWGAMTDTAQIRAVLDAFVGDGYQQRVYDSVEEVHVMP